MTVNYEIKSQLAKLLATEDLVVENKKVETACFNVETRVLTLPLWDKASNTVYDLLVAHEVGHALYTPNVDWTEKVDINPMFVNIVEDARIEKLMKRKYAGLSKTFYYGYQELNDEDFFSIGEKGANSYGLADKVNLYFKIGNFVNINFVNSEENRIVDLINDAETFDDVLIAAEELYKYCKDENKKNKLDDFDSHQDNSNSSSDQSQSENSSEENSSEEGGEELSESMNDNNTDLKEDFSNSDSRSSSGEPKVETMENLDQKLKDLNSLFGKETRYLEVPDINLETFIVDNAKIHQEIDQYFSSLDIEYDDSEYKKFKKSAQKEVNYLVKEFECKKSADAYSRSFVSKSGVLDTSKLHTYKYNEDLFKKVNIIPDGKNHGLIFILDWSGSMNGYIMDTLKQLYNLIWFCQKVSIPFDVYIFTNAYKSIEYDEDGSPIYPQKHHKMEENKFLVPEDVCLINILKSGLKNNHLEKQMINIWRNVIPMSRYCNYSHYYKLGLGGTPLNEALISLHKIIPIFKEKNKVQKVQCIALTDGEGSHLLTTKKVKRYYDGTDEIRPWRVTDSDFLRNRKTGHTYKLPEDYLRFTDVVLKDLRQSFSDVNFIGIRILSGNDFNRMNRAYNGYNNPDLYNKTYNSWKKEKSSVIYTSGYHAYFMIQSASLQNDSEFEVSENATKSQIKSAFQKSLKSKKMNKKLLGEFVELVA